MAKKNDKFVKSDEQLQEVNEALTGAGQTCSQGRRTIFLF